jgi:DNA-binding LacI/PurR family transcriptional regulator
MATPSRPTLSDIAKRARISIPAVSMALADNPRISLKTKRLVWKISEELGYRARSASDAGGRNMPSPSIRRVGLLVTGVGRMGPRTIHNPVVSAMMMCLSTQAAELDIGAELLCLTGDLAPAVVASRAAAFSRGFDGVVATGQVGPELVAALAEAEVPYVVLGNLVEPATAECVTYDGEAAGRLATAFLGTAGHRRIAFLCEGILPGGAMHRWYHGYAIEHLERGLPLDPTLKILTDPFIDPVMETFDALFARPEPPTAVLVPNPFLAQALLAWQAQHRRTIPLVTLEIREMPLPSLAGLPAIVFSVEQLTDQVLRRLLELCIRPTDAPLTTHVPFTTRGL